MGGAAYCWSSNGNGQVGTGSTNGGGYGQPVPVFGTTHYLMISAGKTHTCAVSIAKIAYCWGYGLNGQLGDGSTTTNQPAPSQVSGGLAFSTVSAGGEHTCGITLTSNAYCWGWDVFGQLGDSSATTSTTPVPVKGGYTFTVISAGEGHTCAVTTTNVAYCWGDNRSGQLGDSTTDFRA